ncbi:Oxalate--CoA ligase [Dichanthelium oligosanthes]|uniref:4-coumarate--CoA ligase n=1 Tax=Dichanthelium oligosanthes TaxID=888268 RepID=A0A1E5W4Z3_9POAL|nr:Oxalate--CoA ligase [Dichanthelium oligosanthes]
MATDAAPTLTALLKKAAAAFPARRAIAVPGKLDITHAALDALVDAAAARLAADAGLVIMFLAVIRARAVAAPLNSAYTQEEFEFYLSDSESRLLITNAEGNPAAQAAAAKLGLVHAAATLHDAAGPVHLTGLPSHAAANGNGNGASQDSAFDNNNNNNEPSDVALFLHTSGTTSRPKGVPLTQGNLAASVQNIRSVYRLAETDATVVVLPLFHVHGLLCGLLSSLASGASVALPAAGRFSASTFWADMRASGATWYTAVPTIHQIILDRHASKPEAAGYPALRFVRSCSASLAPVILEKLEAAFGAPVLEAYAMTEASHLMTSNPLPQDGARKPGSVGRPVGQEMTILDEQGARVAPGSPGEVCIRGPNVTRGYKGNPEANEAAFRFGWFHTGDIGVVDDEGYLHLVGRIKELINRGGEKISPIEVDAVLLDHPAVAQAVSFGVPDDKFGEEINCAVIVREGSSLGEEEVVAHCRRNLASFKVPKKVFITDDLPKTATGKIQRRIVAQHFLQPAAAKA